MDRATKISVEKYPHGAFDGELGDSLRAACAVGYMQAEKDLALTPEDVVAIVSLYKQGIGEGDSLEDVIRKFNEQKVK